MLSARWVPSRDTWLALTTPGGLLLYDLCASAAAPAVVVEIDAGAPLASTALVPTPSGAFKPQTWRRERSQPSFLHANNVGAVSQPTLIRRWLNFKAHAL